MAVGNWLYHLVKKVHLSSVTNLTIIIELKIILVIQQTHKHNCGSQNWIGAIFLLNFSNVITFNTFWDLVVLLFLDILQPFWGSLNSKIVFSTIWSMSVSWSLKSLESSKFVFYLELAIDFLDKINGNTTKLNRIFNSYNFVENFSCDFLKTWNNNCNY